MDRLFQAIAPLSFDGVSDKICLWARGRGEFLHLMLIILGRQNLYNYVQKRNRWTFDLDEGIHWELQSKPVELHSFTRSHSSHPGLGGAQREWRAPDYQEHFRCSPTELGVFRGTVNHSTSFR